MRLKENEPSLLESILAHEVTGHLQDAATCYEKYAQQGNIENDKIQVHNTLIIFKILPYYKI